MDVNLVITYDPVHADAAIEEVEAVFDQIGVKPKFFDSEYGGNFFLHVSNPRKSIRELKKRAAGGQDIFSWTHHYIPIDHWVDSEIEDMQKAVKSLASGIGDGQKWKLELDKRHYHRFHERELVIKLTDMVENGEVDLEKPEKIIKVEIIGKHAGISLLDPQDVLVVSQI